MRSFAVKSFCRKCKDRTAKRMTNIIDCAAILFDLDGVLVDSTGSVARQWREWAEEHNIDPRSRSGDRARRAHHRNRTPAGAASRRRSRSEATGETRGGRSRRRRVMPGAAELLRVDSRRPLVRGDLRHPLSGYLPVEVLANLPIPRVLVSADDVSKGKPDPEPYLMGAKTAGHESR